MRVQFSSPVLQLHLVEIFFLCFFEVLIIFDCIYGMKKYASTGLLFIIKSPKKV